MNKQVLDHALDKTRRPEGKELLYCEQFLSLSTAGEVLRVLLGRSDVYGAGIHSERQCVHHNAAPGRFDVVAWGRREVSDSIPWDGKCGTCKYMDGSECHRHAPAVDRWPYIGHFDWCGDWERKESR